MNLNLNLIKKYIKGVLTTSNENTYSCSYMNNNFPTKDGIIETTTSGNVTCYKYSDGTLIASGYGDNFNVNSGSGNPQTFNLPVAFINTDYIVIPSIRNTGAYWSQVAIAGKVNSKSQVQIDCWNDSAGQATLSVQFIAIGRWK